MHPHKVNEIGLPIDPELKRLEFRLGQLSRQWRGYSGNPDVRERIVKEYHKTMEQLYNLGWDGELDIDEILPKEFMPEEYLKRVPWWYDDKLNW